MGEPFHLEGPGKPPQSGLDPQRRSYFSYATFNDPDGNNWLLQEVTTRFPGRGLSSMDVATLVPLLREAEERHGKYEAIAPKHHWSDWYAAYLVARERGRRRRKQPRMPRSICRASSTREVRRRR